MRVSLICSILVLLVVAGLGAAAWGQVGPAGSVSGTAVDPDGAQLVGAEITVSWADGADPAKGGSLTSSPLKPGFVKAKSDAAGRFTVLGVPAGEITVTATAAGFADGHARATLGAGETLELPDLVLPVAADTEDISVQPTRHDMAEADVIAEEHQRLGGFVPNFYVTYNWHAPPLTAGQKFRLAARTAFDPANFAISAAIAGVEQGLNTYSGYGQGAAGYGKRLGAAAADLTTGSFIGGAILPVVFHQDPRYFYKGTGSVVSRALYALATAVICRGDNGRWQPNYSSVLGDVATGAISNVYYPASDRNGATLTIENGLLNAAEDGVGNLIQEFVFRRISPGLPPAKP